MEHLNRLDTVWASMSAGDRIVLLGHDRDFLDDTDKARLAAIADVKANRTAQPARTGNRRPRRTRTPV